MFGDQNELLPPMNNYRFFCDQNDILPPKIELLAIMRHAIKINFGDQIELLQTMIEQWSIKNKVLRPMRPRPRTTEWIVGMLTFKLNFELLKIVLVLSPSDDLMMIELCWQSKWTFAAMDLIAGGMNDHLPPMTELLAQRFDDRTDWCLLAPKVRIVDDQNRILTKD